MSETWVYRTLHTLVMWNQTKWSNCGNEGSCQIPGKALEKTIDVQVIATPVALWLNS